MFLAQPIFRFKIFPNKYIKKQKKIAKKRKIHEKMRSNGVEMLLPHTGRHLKLASKCAQTPFLMHVETFFCVLTVFLYLF